MLHRIIQKKSVEDTQCSSIQHLNFKFFLIIISIYEYGKTLEFKVN